MAILRILAILLESVRSSVKGIFHGSFSLWISPRLLHRLRLLSPVPSLQLFRLLHWFLVQRLLSVFTNVSLSKSFTACLACFKQHGRRFTAFLFSFFVFFGSIAFPVSSYAVTINTVQVGGRFIPITGSLANPSLLPAVEFGASALSKLNPWIAGITTAVVIAEIVHDIAAPALEIRSMNVSQPVPSWTNNNPPASYPAAQQYAITSAGPYYVSKDAACQGNYGPSYGGTWTFDTVNLWCTNGSIHGGVITWYYRSNCTAGYTLSGSSCNLSNAAIVPYPSDGIPTVVNNNGVFQADPRDTDTVPSGIVGQSVITNASTDGKDSIQTTARTDGGLDVETHHRYTDTDGSLRDFVQNMTVNNNGNVISYSTTNNINNVTNGVQNSQPTNFPNDYNREATQQQMLGIEQNFDTDRNSAKTSADQVTSSLNGTKASQQGLIGGLNLPPTDHSPYTAQDTSGMNTALPSSTSSSCVTIDSNLPYFGNIQLNPCPIIAISKPFVNYMIIALSCIGAVFIVLGKREEA